MKALEDEPMSGAEFKMHTADGELLLDLVKAFEQVHHWLLLREAIALRYPFRVLRMSVAVCRMPRVLRFRGQY